MTQRPEQDEVGSRMRRTWVELVHTQSQHVPLNRGLDFSGLHCLYQMRGLGSLPPTFSLPQNFPELFLADNSGLKSCVQGSYASIG